MKKALCLILTCLLLGGCYDLSSFSLSLGNHFLGLHLCLCKKFLAFLLTFRQTLIVKSVSEFLQFVLHSVFVMFLCI